MGQTTDAIKPSNDFNDVKSAESLKPEAAMDCDTSVRFILGKPSLSVTQNGKQTIN